MCLPHVALLCVLICFDVVFQRIKPNLSSGLTVSVVVRFRQDVCFP